MRNENNIGAEREQRINPSIFNLRYYHLRQLKRNIVLISKKYFSKNQILLDFGCGSMPYRNILSASIHQYLGADIKENSAAQIEINIETGKILLEDCSVDIVLSTQVLEHVVSPLAYLRESNRVLKEAGLLVLSTHGVWMYHPDPTDFWRWTADGLSKIISDEGFEVIEIRGVMGLASVGFQQVQDALIYKVPVFCQPILAFFMQPLIWLGDIIHSDEQRRKNACVFFVIAKKKN
jgi:SAM-dependent methyltransferase